MAFVPDSTPDSPIFFGYKAVWWAFKSDDPYAVANAVGLTDAEPCNWATGIPAVADKGIYVCPPLSGWVIVVGLHIPPISPADSKETMSYLLEFSSQFGEVQAFCAHRVADCYVWTRAVNSKLICAYCYFGEIEWNTGNEETESKLSLKLATPEDIDDAKFDFEAFDWPEESNVMEVAREWSVSPEDLEEYDDLGVGLIGFNTNILGNIA